MAEQDIKIGRIFGDRKSGRDDYDDLYFNEKTYSYSVFFNREYTKGYGSSDECKTYTLPEYFSEFPQHTKKVEELIRVWGGSKE